MSGPDRWTHRYVWDTAPTYVVVRAWDNEWLACPHQQWRWDASPPVCRACLEPGLRRLVEEGARDDEILPAYGHLPMPDRRWMERTLDRLRRGPDEDGPTGFALERIAEMTKLYPAMARSAKGRKVSRSAMATRVEIDRETISAWVKRGWMTWPPSKNPQG